MTLPTSGSLDSFQAIREGHGIGQRTNQLGDRMLADGGITGRTVPLIASAEGVETHDPIAAVYDELTAADDYSTLVRLILDAINRHGYLGRSTETFLDLATGTGKVAIELAARGYAVEACDISGHMLTVARSKPGIENVNFIHADMRTVVLDHFVDAVTCIDDGINYLLTDDDVAATFARAYNALNPGGVFVFDVNSLLGFSTTFATLSVSQGEGWVHIWDGRGSASAEPSVVATLNTSVLKIESDGHWKKFETNHVERHYPRLTLERLLIESGFAPAAFYGLQPSGTLNPNFDEGLHHKAIVVATKPHDAPIREGGES